MNSGQLVRPDEWPQELSWKNIRAIPSHHFTPVFARMVVEQSAKLGPGDLIAVELPEHVKNVFLEGVKLLPCMTGVLTSQVTSADIFVSESEAESEADQQHRSDSLINSVISAGHGHIASCEKSVFMPISPEDSIVEAVRCALERELQIEFVDLNLPADSQVGHALEDPSLLEYLSITDYLARNAAAIAATAMSSVFKQRELYMASRLKKLAKEFRDRRILFVCGMIHWQRIREHLLNNAAVIDNMLRKPQNNSAVNQNPEPAQPGLYKMPPEVYARVGTPFRAAAYESARTKKNFGYYQWLHELLLATAKECSSGFSCRELENLIKYCSNLATVKGCLELKFNTLLLAVYEMTSPDFFNAFSALLLKYDVQAKSASIKGSFALDANNNVYVNVLQPGGKLQKIEVKLHSNAAETLPRPAELPVLPSEIRTKVREAPQKSPENQIPGGESEGFGRFHDEMLAEERFIETLEFDWYQANDDEEYNVHEFSGGLLDGLDVRETFRNRETRKWFVKETRTAGPRFAMVLIEFEKDSGRNRQAIYTYGVHKGLAYCRNADNKPSSKAKVAKKAFGQLLSFKRNIDYQRLKDLYSKFVRLDFLVNDPREALARIAFEFAAEESRKGNLSDRIEGDILIVAAEKSFDDYRKWASEIGLPVLPSADTSADRADQHNHIPQGPKVFLQAIDSRMKQAFARIQQFNIYFK